MITPFGLAIRKARLDKGQTKLMTMAEDLGVSPSYLSAIEHGKKPISDALVKQVFLYFKELQMGLDDWGRLAAESQPQLKLDLRSDRELKLAFGRQIDGLPQDRKEMIRKLLMPDND